jgi:hypothetical protein
MTTRYTHKARMRVVTPDRDMVEWVPLHRSERAWVDHKRRSFCPDTGRRLNYPYTNSAVIDLHTLKERT